jgi:hypothetical protein
MYKGAIGANKKQKVSGDAKATGKKKRVNFEVFIYVDIYCK